MTKLTPQKSMPMELTDTQLVVLSRAAQRDDGAATLPEDITDKAALKLAATLIATASSSGSGDKLIIVTISK